MRHLGRRGTRRAWQHDETTVTLCMMIASVRTLTVSVEVPLSTGDGTAPDPATVGSELRLLWIIEQVRIHRIGVGKGADLAGMPRAAFMQTLGAHGVPVIDYPVADLQEELARAGS